MNYLDLFHGIGGFALGAYWAGMKFEHHYCSDIEPWCQELYAKRFPGSIQLGDITKIDATKLPTGDWIITGGFPCQDISIAGKGAGIHGERSGLWFEYWRLINDLRPRFAIMENVGMLVHRGLREVLGSLAEIGYDAEWQDIRASDVGAPHRRERIWIVAYPSSESATGHAFGAQSAYAVFRDGGEVADTSSNRQQWSGSGSATQEGLQPRSEHTGELESRPEGCGEDVADTDDSGSRASRCSLDGAGASLIEGRSGEPQFEFGRRGEVADTSVQGLEGEEPAGCRSGEPGLSSECRTLENSGGSRSRGKSEKIKTDRGRGTWRDESAFRQAYREDGANRIDTAGGIEGWSGQWWSTECRICRMVDELSERMDGNGLTNKPGCDNGLLSQGVLDGKAEKRRTKDTLSQLREGVGEENIQRSSRGLIGIQETEILQPGVYVKSDDTKASDTIGVPGESKKTIRLSLRDMRDGPELAVSSCEQGCIGQPPGKRANALCELPFKMALAEWENISEEIKLVLLNLRRACSEIRYVPETLSETEEIWRSFNDEEKDWIALRVSSGSPWCHEWPMTGRLTAKQARRVDRLRGLGNAIVPQIAKILFRQIIKNA